MTGLRSFTLLAWGTAQLPPSSCDSVRTSTRGTLCVSAAAARGGPRRARNCARERDGLAADRPTSGAQCTARRDRPRRGREAQPHYHRGATDVRCGARRHCVFLQPMRCDGELQRDCARSLSVLSAMHVHGHSVCCSVACPHPRMTPLTQEKVRKAIIADVAVRIARICPRPMLAMQTRVRRAGCVACEATT